LERRWTLGGRLNGSLPSSGDKPGFNFDWL
jgi:hypothetical protein